MKKKVEDYLHLYLGCEVKASEGTEIYILTGVTTDGGALFRTKGSRFSIDIGHDFKLILRELSDMTEEEKEECGKINDAQNWVYVIVSNSKQSFRITPERVQYLLSKHFDLFGLIKSGLAINKTTLK